MFSGFFIILPKNGVTFPPFSANIFPNRFPFRSTLQRTLSGQVQGSGSAGGILRSPSEKPPKSSSNNHSIKKKHPKKVTNFFSPQHPPFFPHLRGFLSFLETVFSKACAKKPKAETSRRRRQVMSHAPESGDLDTWFGGLREAGDGLGKEEREKKHLKMNIF